MENRVQKEKVLTVKREKLKSGRYLIREFEDGNETTSYFAECKRKLNGLILIDSRNCLNMGDTFSYGEGPAHHSWSDHVFTIDVFGRPQGKYTTYFRSTLNGNSEYSTYYKNGIAQPKSADRPSAEKGLKGISNRLANLFFGKKKEKQLNPKDIKSQGGRG